MGNRSRVPFLKRCSSETQLSGNLTDTSFFDFYKVLALCKNLKKVVLWDDVRVMNVDDEITQTLSDLLFSDRMTFPFFNTDISEDWLAANLSQKEKKVLLGRVPKQCPEQLAYYGPLFAKWHGGIKHVSSSIDSVIISMAPRSVYTDIAFKMSWQGDKLTEEWATIWGGDRFLNMEALDQKLEMRQRWLKCLRWFKDEESIPLLTNNAHLNAELSLLKKLLIEQARLFDYIGKHGQ